MNTKEVLGERPAAVWVLMKHTTRKCVRYAPKRPMISLTMPRCIYCVRVGGWIWCRGESTQRARETQPNPDCAKSHTRTYITHPIPTHLEGVGLGHDVGPLHRHAHPALACATHPHPHTRAHDRSECNNRGVKINPTPFHFIFQIINACTHTYLPAFNDVATRPRRCCTPQAAAVGATVRAAVAARGLEPVGGAMATKERAVESTAQSVRRRRTAIFSFWVAVLVWLVWLIGGFSACVRVGLQFPEA